MIRLPAEERAKLRQLDADKRALLRPVKNAERQQRRADRQAREPRQQRIVHDTGKQTRGRVLDKGYLSWLRRLPCIAGLVASGCDGPVEAAHLRYADAQRGRPNPGLSTKPSDRFATPLCAHHHRGDQHTRSERAFWADLHIEPGDLTAELYAAYQAGADGLPVLLRFASDARSNLRSDR